MGEPVVKEDKIYTYGDYKRWPDDERWELIEGVAYNMSPAPRRFHQGIIFRLSNIIGRYLEGKSCEAYPAPFDVLLPALGEEKQDNVTTVVQPDISVICDKSKLTDEGCTGSPDWIIEILSPSTSRKDFNEKLRLYELHGVREYWIVDPANFCVHVYLLQENGMYPKTPLFHEKSDKINGTVLAGLTIGLEELFRQG